MKEFVPVTLQEQAGLNRVHEPLLFGVPLPEGFARSTNELVLTNTSGAAIPADITTAVTWPDRSLRWVHVHTLAQVPALSQQQLHLCRRTAANTNCGPTTAQPEVDYKSGSLSWSNNGPTPVHYGVTLTDAQGSACKARCDSDWTCTLNGTLARTHRISGDWLRQDGERLARFTCQVTTYAGTRLLKVEVCLHNPRRARHPGGLWDLGDEGSVHFRSLTVSARQEDSPVAHLHSEPGATPIALTLTECARLHQESSGGEYWNSLNHVNAQGAVVPGYRGYRLTQGAQELSSGLRAAPRVTLSNRDGQKLHTSYPKFWQNFPSAIEANPDTLSLQLFPETGEPYELQGGERKTQTLWFEVSENPDSLAWTHQPLIPQVPAGHYQDTSAFPWFVANQPREPLDELIDLGLDGDQNFFAKREIIDEFGWRNFGDIFADHETLYQKPGEAPLISHYNNQYDAIYGFARQFALTGDSRWFELMDDLARHVTDIDIYHTDEDRAEYNHGLFWHTDHYLPAHTATHRTFTRHNDTSSTPGQTGGGPAEEHCYSTGLLYHYCLTGCEDSRLAVLGLATWMSRLHEGTNTLFESLLRIKRYDLPRIKALLQRRKVSPHTYLFTRGTGNYIQTLLDASILAPEEDWLMQAEKVIRGTIHPNDNLESRHLLDVENSWSYLILLASISRYLTIKQQEGTCDYSYQYALASFRHYTRWILAHEEPFLTHPEQLEFANQTWAAQDIRKAMLMYQAACFDPEYTEEYLSKAQEWMDYVIEALRDNPETHLTRIQIILLQNYGPHHPTNLNLPESALETSLLQGLETHPPKLSLTSLSARISRRLLTSLVNFRPSREKAWLNARLDR